MHATRTASSRWAEYIGRLSTKDLPGQVEHMARLCIMDWIGCAVAGSARPGTIILRDVATRGGSTGNSSLIGGGLAADAAVAALHNGYASHVLEYDDTHPSAFSHISSPVLAAAFAVAEERDLTLEELVLAFVAGYETAARFGIALGGRMFQDFHVHPTGYLGYLGSAVAAGKLLNLSDTEMEMALAIAGLQAGGLLEGVATMSEGLCAAHSSAGGLLAARLASAGFQGPTTIIDGAAGIFAAFGVPRELDVLADDRFELLNNEFKMYPSCGFTHPVLDAVLELRNELPPFARASDISVTVRLWTPAADLVDRATPVSASEAQFSAQFCVAVALIDGAAGPLQFTDERTQDPGVLAMISAVTIERDDTMNRHQAHVSISSGTSKRERFVTNEGREPDEQGLIQKFVTTTREHYGPSDVDEIAKLLLTLDNYKVSDLLLPIRRSPRTGEGGKTWCQVTLPGPEMGIAAQPSRPSVDIPNMQSEGSAMPADPSLRIPT